MRRLISLGAAPHHYVASPSTSSRHQHLRLRTCADDVPLPWAALALNHRQPLLQLLLYYRLSCCRIHKLCALESHSRNISTVAPTDTSHLARDENSQPKFIKLCERSMFRLVERHPGARLADWNNLAEAGVHIVAHQETLVCVAIAKF